MEACLGPVDHARDLPACRIREDVHLVEVAVGEHDGELPGAEFWEEALYLGDVRGEARGEGIGKVAGDGGEVIDCPGKESWVSQDCAKNLPARSAS